MYRNYTLTEKMGNHIVVQARYQYRTSINVFLSKLTDSLDVIINRYDNILILRDLNIDLMDPNDQEFNNLIDFCEIFDVTNQINFDIYVTRNHSSSIDAILTNRKGCVKNSGTVETGASDFHKMVLTMFNVHFIEQKPIKITYRDYRYFNESVFLHNLSKGCFFPPLRKPGSTRH